MYKEYKYRKLANARKKANEMKSQYGYTPSVFRIQHPKTKKNTFVVVKPGGLKRV